MSGRGFTSAFAAELDAYLAFKQSMGYYGASRDLVPDEVSTPGAASRAGPSSIRALSRDG